MTDTEWGIDRTMHEQGREIDRLRAEVERVTARAEKAEREREEMRKAAADAEAVAVKFRADAIRTARRIRELEAALREAWPQFNDLIDLFEVDDEANTPGTDSYTVLHLAKEARDAHDELARTLLTPTAPDGGSCAVCESTDINEYQFTGRRLCRACATVAATPTQKGDKE